MSLPQFERFVYHGEESTSENRWKVLINKLENLLCGLDITSDQRKKALLLHYGGDDIYELFDSMSDEQKGVDSRDGDGNPNQFQVFKESLTTYFTPKRNTSFETFKFRRLTQQAGEGIDAFYTRLRRMSANCDFANTEREILAQIIQGCTSTKVRRRALKDDLTLQQVIDEARSLELAETRASEIEGLSTPFNDVSTHTGDATAYSVRGSRQNQRFPSQRGSSHQVSSQRGSSNQAPSQRGYSRANPVHRGATDCGSRDTLTYSTRSYQQGHCGWCGGHSHARDYCPAKDRRCHNCDKVGHFSKVCRFGKPKVRLLHDSLNSDVCDFENEDADTHDTEEKVFIYGVSKNNTHTPKATLRMLNTNVGSIVDTDASENI